MLSIQSHGHALEVNALSGNVPTPIALSVPSRRSRYVTWQDGPPPTSTIRPHIWSQVTARARASPASLEWMTSKRLARGSSNMMGDGERNPIIGTSASRTIDQSRSELCTSSSHWSLWVVYVSVATTGSLTRLGGGLSWVRPKRSNVETKRTLADGESLAAASST